MLLKYELIRVLGSSRRFQALCILFVLSKPLLLCSRTLLVQQRERGEGEGEGLLASVAGVLNFIVNFISGNRC